jgi:hypothetical protein
MFFSFGTSSTLSGTFRFAFGSSSTLPGTFRFATPPLFPAFIFFQKCIFRSKEQQKIASKFQVTHKKENGYNNMNNTSLITNHADGEGTVSRNGKIKIEGVKILKPLVFLLILLRRSKLMQDSLAISKDSVKWKLMYLTV